MRRSEEVEGKDCEKKQHGKDEGREGMWKKGRKEGNVMESGKDMEESA